MHKLYTYIAGAKRGYCEDALYADENCAFVIDGATGVSGEKVTDCATDAAWFSAAHRAYLAGALKGDGEIAEILKTGVWEVAARYARFDGADKVKDKPSAVISVVRERNGYLEYYSLGDTVVVIRKKDGEVLHILDTRLVELDNINFGRMKEIAARTGKTLREAFADIRPYILENRAKMNTLEGYCALSHTAEGLDTALTGKIPLSEVRDLLVFSDGFAEIYDLFGLYPSPAALIADVAENGILPAMKKLHAAQDSDPDCEKFVRNKLRDDISVVYAEI